MVSRPHDHSLTARIRAAAARDHGVVRRKTLVALGASSTAISARVTTGRLVARARGLYVVPDLCDEWTELVLILGGCALLAASHRTAAAIRRWDGFDRPEPEVLAWPDLVSVWTSRPEARRHRRKDISLSDLTVVSRMRTTSAPWTLGTLAEVPGVGCDQVEQAVESALRSQHVTEDGLWSWVVTHRDPAAAVLGAVLERRGRSTPPTESMLETLTVQLVLRRFGIEVLGRQVEVWEGRRRHGRPDFLLGGWTILEVDGPHHDDPVQRRQDADRDLRMATLGLQVIRTGWREVTGAPRLLAGRIDRVVDLGRRAHQDRPLPFDGQALRFPPG